MRLTDDDKAATHQVFRQWLGKERVVTEEKWMSIMSEDDPDPSPVHQCDNGHSGYESNEQVETEVITGAFAGIES